MKFKRILAAAGLAAALLGAQAFLFAGPAAAADKVCKYEITGNDLMQFDKKELVVAPDCTQVELTLKHTGKLPAQAMGHNWVLTKTADVAPVANEGLADITVIVDHNKFQSDSRSASITTISGR